MSTTLPEISGSRSTMEGASIRSKSSSAILQPTTQARFGYLGKLNLKEAQSAQSDALRNVSALDSSSFLPHVMTLQRPSTPWQYNTPQRVLEQPVAIQGQGGEVAAVAQSKSGQVSQPLPSNYVRRVRRRAQESKKTCNDHRQQLADLKLLADSASRSGNIYQAMQAYHKMGVIYDNQGQYQEAVQKYKQFLALCISSKNSQGEALAYNCLGIDEFKLGQFDESIQYFNKQLELADSTGRLIAHTNLGIVFQAMGLAEHAAIHHQHAIEYANRMGAKDAQCFTVGNLGVASAAQGDLQTSRICLQYHLNAASKQKLPGKFASQTFKKVSNNALHRLGQVNTTDGRLDEAASHFEQAMAVARGQHCQSNEEQAGAMLGIARGLLSFEDHCQALVNSGSQA
eukprot:CAMPEP_0206488600 /NCGR_PEP_ID=MMETSP0324_2-20121206/42552_1 /ASSEMBLY_ACC=CAM_ASM_000836 /TAXON_ID=2866 /ORGANISM="Crypthecodinium cohnii, Strain Seligo" /LENGTH=398 /DNA_ID=CAMNT_0053967741 /DNA_START=33 /DNA_END=1225 /DNA_ORIENTATION=-